MAKKLLGILGWAIGLSVLALCCWLLGVFFGWPLWQSAALFLGVIVACLILAWLRRRWHAWRLRRRLARPATSMAESTAQLDADWRAGLAALRQSRLSRFGSPLYVLPWFLTLGPQDDSRSAMLRRAAGRDAVSADGDDTPILQWWLLPGVVMLDPASSTTTDVVAPSTASWKRMLHWMMRSRRREPLNGLVLSFSSFWLTQTSDAELFDTGHALRQRLDELVRVYNARVPIYIVLTHCEAQGGFTSWAKSLDDGTNKQAMGYLNERKLAGIGEFIDDAFGYIVARMGDLRVLQGIYARLTPDVLGLPERMFTLADRLDKVLRPAFQATPYAETPLLRGLFLTGSRTGADSHEADWFSAGLLNDVLPAQRNAWQPLERMRHWRRLLRHAAVTGWLLVCVAAGAFMIHTAHTAQDQLRISMQGADLTAVDFSGGLSSDLHALQSIRHAILTLDKRSQWKRRWLPFQQHVNVTQEKLEKAYANAFYGQVLTANLNPVLVKILAENRSGAPDQAAIAMAQNLVRRINLLQAKLAGEDLNTLPSPGTEVQALMTVIQDGTISMLDGLLLGDMYRDYLVWQQNTQVLNDERRALQKALDGLGLSARPIQWVNTWAGLQPDLQPMRLSDFWNIGEQPDLPEVSGAMTLEGKTAVTAFLQEIARASDNPQAWNEREAQYQQLFLDDGLQRWYAFSDAFVHAPDLIADVSARRTVLSSLMTANDPYRQYMGRLSKLGQSLPDTARPEWLSQAIRLDKLTGLVQLSEDESGKKANAVTSSLTTLQNLQVVQSFGGDVIKALPAGNPLKQGFSSLGADQQALALMQSYQKGVQSTVQVLQQGEGNAMQEAVQIWSYGQDPAVKEVALVDAYDAMAALRKSQDVATDSRSTVVWQLTEGAMDFTLDYAARSAACKLQSEWEASVLGAVQGLTDKQLADTLLFGKGGQVNVFLDGDAKHFLSRNGSRYVARDALGITVPFNGQFYAFASMAQRHQASVAGQQLATQRTQDANTALKDQATQLDEKISKLQEVKGNVTISTEPPQTNAQARLRPESLTLSLQCASGPIVLQNLNFANSQVFSWSMANCADTELLIRYPGFELRQQWSGAGGFIQFLNVFASGQHRYTPADFPMQASAMEQADIEWLDVNYRQVGQEAVLKAFTQADKLNTQAQEIQGKLDAMQDAAANAPQTQGASGPAGLPNQIVTICMGPASSIGQQLASNVDVPAKSTAGTRQKAKPTATQKPGKKSANSSSVSPPKPGTYAVQVGIFAHTEKVRKALTKSNYTIQDEPITLHGKHYRNIRVGEYDTRQKAEEAAKQITELLKVKPVVVGQP